LLHFCSPKTIRKTLILGTGGASLAAKFTLEKNGLETMFVARVADDSIAQNKILTYQELTASIISETTLLVNCTPVGTFPNTDTKPLPLPYHLFSSQHFYFDMIYNPSKTRTAQLLEQQGVHLKNGLEMLLLQAEKSWEIWNL
jgi:shikimate dehydrogenase